MSSLEWFYRMENGLRISLPEISAEFNEFEILFETDTTEKHPVYSFIISTAEQVYEFCVIQFDPVNQEFYSYHYDEDVELDSKVLFDNLDDMLQFIYDSCIEFVDELYGDEEVAELEFFQDDLVEDEELDVNEENLVFSTIDETEDIDWISNDKHIHIESNHLNESQQFVIHLKMGIDPQSGDGILYRNVISQSGDEMEETAYFPFKQEEAAYMIDLLNDYLSYSNNS